MDIGISKGELKPLKPYKRRFKKFLLVLLLILFLPALIILRVQTKYADQIVSGNELISPSVGLVFGAGLRRAGEPSDILKDRIKTAIQLYQDNKVGRFIFSADSVLADYDEVLAMKNFALSEGLPPAVIINDNFGVNTYESCQRLKNEFGLSSAVLITQKYHLRRALYICNELGIGALGVAAIDRGYAKQLMFTLREYLASLRAWYLINF